MKVNISAFDLKIDDLTLDEQIKLNYIKENNETTSYFSFKDIIWR